MGNLEERQEEHQGGVSIHNSAGMGADGRQEANSSPSIGMQQSFRALANAEVALLFLTSTFCLNLQGSRSRAKLTAANPNLQIRVSPTVEGNAPPRCPLSTLREIITDKLRPNPNGVGTTGRHPQVFFELN